MTFETLRALHTIIGDALTEMERIYKDQSGVQGIRLDYPSLDDPYYRNNAKHTIKEEAAEKLAADPAIVVAASHIVAACGQLAASVHRPFLSLIDGTKSGHLGACLQFLETSNTVEILRAAGPDGLHVAEIARRIDELNAGKDASVPAEPLDSGKLSHILRLLATFHWLREVSPDVFANNRLSSIVDSGKTPEELHEAPLNKYDDSDCVAAIVALTADDFYKSMAYMTDAYLPSKARSSALRILSDKNQSRAETKYKLPFNLAFRTELGYFDWLELPENKVRLAEFGRAMTGSRMWEIAENVLDAFPWKNLEKDSVVIDVGGGIGSTSVVLAEAFPHLRFVVEDREQVIGMAPSAWEGEKSELIKSGRVSFQAHSFFDPQPSSINVAGVGPISSPSVFLVRGCTHNWPDDAVLKMLRHLRNAANASTKLLLVEMVLPLACYDDTEDVGEAISGAERSLAPDGSPLLANLGKASANGYLLDLSMMVTLESKERTLREMSTLALAAGWKIKRMTRGKGSLWAYLIAEPV